MANEVKRYLHDGMELPFEDWSKTLHSFNDLASIVQTTHDAAQSSAVKAINRMQTMRNWLIGYYIVEFEQHGKDRAEYGTQLLKKLEERVDRKGLTTTLFKWARKFYRLYPQMMENLPIPICATVMHQLQPIENKEDTIGASMTHQVHPRTRQGLLLRGSPKAHHHRRRILLSRPCVLQPHTALRRNHRVEERGVLLRELRTAQRIRIALSRERDATWRQPSNRHPALHTQRQKDGGVRARRHG